MVSNGFAACLDILMTFQVLVSGLSQAQRNPDGHFCSLHGAQVLLGSSGKVSSGRG